MRTPSTRAAVTRIRGQIMAAVRPAWMGRNLTVLAAARIPMSAARAMAAVVVPIYLALIGFSGTELGGLFLASGLASAALSSSSGLLSDRIGRKGVLVVMPALATVAAVVYAVTTRPVPLFIGAALGSFGRGAGAGAGAVGPYQPVESAMLTQSTTARWRNAAFGRLFAASSVGALAGALLATVAGGGHAARAEAAAAFRPVFILAACLPLAASLISLALREPRACYAPEPGRSAPEPGGSARAAPRRPVRFPRRSLPLLSRLWVVNTVNGIAVGMFGPFVSYWFFRRYGVGPAELGVLYAVINAVTVLSGLAAAGVARRVGLLHAVVAGRLLQGLLLVPMALAPTFWAAGLVYLVRMGVQRVALPLRQSFVLAAAHPEELASVAALSNLPSQLAMSGAPIASGYLFDEVSLDLPFVLAGALQALNALMYLLFFRSVVPEEERPLSADLGNPTPQRPR